MVHGAGLDPHWFDYPTLLLYVLAPFQAWQDEPSYLTARLIVVAFGVAAVAAAWWLGRAAYGKTAGFVAARGRRRRDDRRRVLAHGRHRRPDDRADRGRLALAVTGRLELAGLAAGLAASAKYPAVFLSSRSSSRRGGSGAGSATRSGLAVVAFLATSPYVLVHPHQAWADASRVQRLAREGWLGFEHDSWALFSFTGKLWDGFGPALVIGVIGLALALYRRTQDRPDPRVLRARLPRRPADDPRALRPLRAAARPRAGGARGQAADPRADHARLL